MPRLSTLHLMCSRQVVAAMSSFMNLISIYVSLGMEIAALVENRYLNPRLARQPIDTYTMSYYDRQRHLKNVTKISDIYIFKRFCEILVVGAGLKRTRNVDIDEMVYTFLRIISHNKKNRTL
ncbi:hypothetical protein LINGRAHAP2_LOCUS14562 [Linum grandiflorum]